MKHFFKNLAFILLFALILPKDAFSQDLVENKYNARITGVAYEDSEQGKTSSFTLEILEGNKKGEIVKVIVNSEDKSIGIKNYKVGDRVILLSTETEEYQEYFITDHIRNDGLIILALAFILCTVIVGRKLGFQSLIGLAITTIVLLTLIIPTIEKGQNIFPIAFAGSCLIAIISIYLSHGFCRKSTIALLGTLASLILTLILGIIFTNLLKLTGYSSEDSLFLIGYEGVNINMKNLLIASLMFGGIGILDDVTVSQVSVVNEICELEPAIDRKKLYQKAMIIGKDHISSMVNTLFLAYASSSLPLIILFRVQNISFGEIINNESIAEEVLRTLVGSIGLILAVPITTALAVYFYKRKKHLE